MRGKRVEVTAEIIDKVAEAIRIRGTYELAARYAGISKDTLDRWRKALPTAKPGTPLAALRDRLADAEGQAAIGWLAKINAAGRQGDWRACAFLLERCYPEIYGRKVIRVAATSPDGQAPAQGLAVLLPSTPPSVAEWAAEQARVNGAGPGGGQN